MAQGKRVKLSELVGRLYTLRIDADYKPSTEVEASEANECQGDMVRFQNECQGDMVRFQCVESTAW